MLAMRSCARTRLAFVREVRRRRRTRARAHSTQSGARIMRIRSHVRAVAASFEPSDRDTHTQTVEHKRMPLNQRLNVIAIAYKTHAIIQWYIIISDT